MRPPAGSYDTRQGSASGARGAGRHAPVPPGWALPFHRRGWRGPRGRSAEYLFSERLSKARPSPKPSRPLEPSITLALGTDDFNGLLSENVQLAHGLFRMLMTGPAAAAWPPVVAPRSPLDSRVAAGNLRPIETGDRARAGTLFVHATAEDLQAVAAIAQEEPIASGADLFKEGQRAAIYTVLKGRVQIARNGKAPAVAAPGDTIGIVETLGDRLTEESATVLEAGSVLRINREALFELLSDRIELLHGLLGTVQASGAGVM